MGKLAAYSRFEQTLSKEKISVDDISLTDERWVIICRKTILIYRNELYDWRVILSEEVTEEYVKFLIWDLNALNQTMNDYKGNHADKMKSVRDQHLRKALLEASAAKTLFVHFDQKDFSTKKAKEAERRTVKLDACREHLDKAYRYLK